MLMAACPSSRKPITLLTTRSSITSPRFRPLSSSTASYRVLSSPTDAKNSSTFRLGSSLNLSATSERSSFGKLVSTLFFLGLRSFPLMRSSRTRSTRGSPASSTPSLSRNSSILSISFSFEIFPLSIRCWQSSLLRKPLPPKSFFPSLTASSKGISSSSWRGLWWTKVFMGQKKGTGSAQTFTKDLIQSFLPSSI